LKINKGIVYCVSPRTGGKRYIHVIERSRVKDLYKEECEKCKLMKICKKYDVIDGKCGVLGCMRRHTLLGIFFNAWSFESKNYIHCHKLCYECYNGIDKYVNINLQIL
jgi:hypothetical protein